MTVSELRHHFNNTFGVKPWPQTFEVDAETYGHVAAYTHRRKLETEPVRHYRMNGVDYGIDVYDIRVSVGIDGGILFKNVELILKP